MKIAIYPGTFDPLTIGHVDIIERSSKLFDKIIVVVSENCTKKKLFTPEERKDMITEALKHLPNVEVDVHRGLVVDYAKQVGAKAIVRGLRAVQDFENELTMAYANKFLDKELETVYLMANIEYSFISSSAVKEIATFSDKYKKLLPETIYNHYKTKF